MVGTLSLPSPVRGLYSFGRGSAGSEGRGEETQPGGGGPAPSTARWRSRGSSLERSCGSSWRERGTPPDLQRQGCRCSQMPTLGPIVHVHRCGAVVCGMSAEMDTSPHRCSRTSPTLAWAAMGHFASCVITAVQAHPLGDEQETLSSDLLL